MTAGLQPDPGSVHLAPDPGSIHPAGLPPVHMPPTPPLGRAAGKAIGGIMDVLARPNQAVLAKHAGRGFFGTLVHGETPAQYQSDTARATREMMMATPQEFANLPTVRRGANEFATQMVTDPLTYLGGTGILRKAFEEAGLHIVPAAMRAAARAGERTHGSSLGDTFQMASEAASWLHDVMTPGGKPIAHAIRELARKQGAHGVAQAERMTSAASGSRSVAAHVGAVGKQLLDQTLHHVPPAAQSAIFKAIHTGSIGSLPEVLRPVADRLVQIDRSIPWLLGTKSVRTKLQKLGFTLPQEFQAFDQGPRSIVNVSKIREHHVPLPHELTPEEGEAALQNLKRKGGSRAQTDVRSAFFARRGDTPTLAFDDPDLIRETWERSFSAAGRAIGGADLRSSLVRIFGQTPKEKEGFLIRAGNRLRTGDLARKPVTIDDWVKMTGQGDELVPRTQLTRSGRSAPERETSAAALRRRVPPVVRAAYGPQPGKDLNGAQQLIRSLENLGNIGKSTLFTTPFPHQRNIATLLALANPTAFPAALANYARMGFGFAKPAAKARVLGGAMRAGATGLPNVEQRGLTDLLQRFGPLGKAASKWYGGVGEMLWGWDDAVKKALYDKELRHFRGDAGRAAASVRRKLVDYSQTSPFQDAIRLVAPFATYRTSMPPAVIRSLFEHPEYGLGLQRATGGVAGGQPTEIGGKPYQFSGPLTDVNELTDPLGGGTSKYIRGSTSLTSKALSDLGALALGQKQVPFSGQYLESNLPVVGPIKNPFGDSFDDRLMFTLTGLHPYKAPRTPRYRRRRRHRPQ